MITSQYENIQFKVFKRKENSPYEYEDVPCCVFRGRIANNIEKQKYRIQSGVNGSSDSIFILSSNLPTKVNISDKIEGLGKVWTVMSVGYYLNQSKLINNGIMSNDYLIERCPKGINLQ